MITADFPQLDLSDLERLARDGVSDQGLRRGAEAARNGMQRRIRSLSLTTDGEKLDRNTTGGAAIKEKAGYPPDPLVAGGELTEPEAWIPDTDANGATLQLASSQREKMDDLSEWANGQRDGRTRNWMKAFGLGPNEKAAAVREFANDINRQLGLPAPVMSDDTAARYLEGD